MLAKACRQWTVHPQNLEAKALLAMSRLPDQRPIVVQFLDKVVNPLPTLSRTAELRLDRQIRAFRRIVI